MPYIPNIVSEHLHKHPHEADTSADLAFVLCDVVASYISRKGLRAKTIIEVFGVLEETKLEIQRRVAGPYESTKHMFATSAREGADSVGRADPLLRVLD